MDIRNCLTGGEGLGRRMSLAPESMMNSVAKDVLP
jgi:hypothetical protein